MDEGGVLPSPCIPMLICDMIKRIEMLCKIYEYIL